MWPLSWSQFCVSLPLEVRTVGLVLFLQVPVLLSVLHCLPPAGHVEPVFSDIAFSAAVRRNNSELYNTEKKVVFDTSAAPVFRYTRHDLLSLETAATPTHPFPLPLAGRASIRSRHCEKRAQKATPIKKRRENERRKIKVVINFRDRLPSNSSSSSTPCRQPAELDFYCFNSALLPHSDECQHDTTAARPASPPSDRDDLTASSLSAPLRPRRQLLITFPLVLPQPKTHS